MTITKAQKFWLESDFVLELLKQIPASVFWKDKNSVYLGCNDTFVHSLGLSSPEEVIGKTDYDLPTTKEESDAFRADDKQVIKSKKPKLNIEEHQTLPNGRRITLLTNKVPLLDKHNNVIGILGIYYDITEHKTKNEKELREAKEKAEAANQLKTAFIRDMEHDIRTPFSGIYSIANHLYEHENEPMKRELLKHVVNSAKELLDYCNTILDFSRIESGVLPLMEKKFDLHKLLDSVITIETPAAKIKNLELLLERSNNLPQIVSGDHYRLQRILINLLSNSIKFTKTGFVKLTAKLQKMDDKRVIISFIVEDTGIGIPDKQQEVIFEKFARVTPANKNLYKGNGLGLKAVKQFVSELEGEVELISEQDKGSIFICTVPFKLPLINEVADFETLRSKRA